MILEGLPRAKCIPSYDIVQKKQRADMEALDCEKPVGRAKHSSSKLGPEACGSDMLDIPAVPSAPTADTKIQPHSQIQNVRCPLRARV